jgi:hypothetical protein
LSATDYINRLFILFYFLLSLSNMSLLRLLTITLLSLSVNKVHSLDAVASYSNLWVNPDFILARNFAPETGAAQNTILEWATLLTNTGPWSMSLPPPFSSNDSSSHFFSLSRIKQICPGTKR